MAVETGLERLIGGPTGPLAGKRLGLLCNPASVSSRLRHASRLIQQRFPGQLKALFSPQHGFFAEKQDNMVESDHMRAPHSNLPVYSLYGKTRIPTPEMLDNIDILVVDIQDVGTRVYTFIYTLSYCMETAAKCGKQILVLDRPNPIGGVLIEGNCIQSNCTSFVGRFPIPMRHGMTIGELAHLFNQAFGIGCNLDVVRMQGWRREMRFEDTGLPWVAPSPNMPTPATALVYPGQVIWEGTNISEGRGTTQPFEIFGAPFIDPGKIQAAVNPVERDGFVLRELAFEPISNKWQGQLCQGFQIHVTDPDRYRPYETSLRILQAILRVHSGFFNWKSPPYEYEQHRLPIDLIIGNEEIRKRIQRLDDMDDIVNSWLTDLAEFDALRQKYLLYPIP
jgi:uncharacterized protein YbbC (DUF1343 family)